MNALTEILIFIILGTLFYIYDIKTQKYNPDCTNTTPKKISFNLNILFHHIISSSILPYGWLSNNKYILTFYILFFLIIILHWKIFGDCIFSLKARQDCNGNYNFPHINQLIMPKYLKSFFNARYIGPIVLIKLILLYKYNDPSILYKINIIIISFIIILYSYNYKKKQDDTGL